ncbi:hypothetical protein CDN99_17425 [Roseateles aquatilis]|uniref:Uncharacterized protein n=1 Tax=Roseateles aquatilis TaxID=431061 RepID=A0A246J507_9BURK|nr:hypothetical protein CDN99_17425 [Roseateles aquatilis]
MSAFVVVMTCGIKARIEQPYQLSIQLILGCVLEVFGVRLDEANELIQVFVECADKLFVADWGEAAQLCKQLVLPACL